MDKMGGMQLVNKVLVLLVIAAVAGAALGGLWLLPPDADASGHGATRSFSPSSVAPGGTVTVTITVTGFGDGNAVGVEDVAPAAFGGGTEQAVIFKSEGSYSYDVTAQDSPGRHIFEGTVRDENKDSRDIGGASTVTITGQRATATLTPTPTPTTPMLRPTASRAMSSWVRPGDDLTVTITASNFGDAGAIEERLPSGFTSNGSGTVQLVLVGPSETVTYTATAPVATGMYTFFGDLLDEEKNRWTIRGRSSVRVGAPPTPTPTSPPDPGPTATPQPTPEPTPTPDPNRAPEFPADEVSRDVPENSAAGTAVGAPVTANDLDRDTLAYTLSGQDAAAFSINRNTGQLQVRAALDFETRNTYMVTVTAADPAGRDDSIDVTVNVTNIDEPGTVNLGSMFPKVGTANRAWVEEDPDGNVTRVTWQWSRSMSMDGTFMGITGATQDSYTPAAADNGYYLRATATYTDGHGPNKTAMATTTAKVTTTDPQATLIARYDANNNGTIEKNEVINAINDYLFNGTLTKPEVIKLINCYLFGC